MASVRLGGKGVSKSGGDDYDLGKKFGGSGVSKSGGDYHDVFVSLGIVVADPENDGLSVESWAFLEKQSEKYRKKIVPQFRASVPKSGGNKFTPN